MGIYCLLVVQKLQNSASAQPRTSLPKSLQNEKTWRGPKWHWHGACVIFSSTSYVSFYGFRGCHGISVVDLSIHFLFSQSVSSCDPFLVSMPMQCYALMSVAILGQDAPGDGASGNGEFGCAGLDFRGSKPKRSQNQNILLQKPASIQPRTSLPKFLTKFEEWGVAGS